MLVFLTARQPGTPAATGCEAAEHHDSGGRPPSLPQALSRYRLEPANPRRGIQSLPSQTSRSTHGRA